MRTGIVRSMAVAACVTALASCGGGGGGGSGGGSTPSLSVTADKSSLQFVGFNTAPPGVQSIQFTLANASAGSQYYGMVVPDRPADFSATFTPTGNTSAVVSLTPLQFPVGTRTGSITFKLCNDVNCNQVAWSQSIPYTTALYTVDASSLTMTGHEGVASPAVNVAVSPADTGRLLSVSTSLTSGSGWLSATRPNDASVAIAATGATVSSGSYQGQVRISVAGQPDGPAVNIPVSFTVGNGAIAPPGATVDLGLTATQTSTAATAPITFQGAQTPTWTATSNQPWLVLSQASGTGPGQVKYAIDPGKTGSIPNWGSATAQVTLHATGLSDVSFPVTVNKKLPELYVASPGVVRTGVASTVRVIGRGLSQLTGSGQIQLAGVGNLAATVTSDTSATFTLPALASGRSALSIANSAAITTSSAVVGAVGAATLPAGTVSTGGSKRSSLFDPTRNALFAVNFTQNTLMRFAYTGGQWQTTTTPVERIGDMALSPDRSTLYVVSGDATLLAIDPDTLVTRAGYTATGAQTGISMTTGLVSTRGLPVTSNLRIWFPADVGSGARYFDLLSASFGSKAGYNGMPFSSSIFASGDGSVMWLGLGTTSTFDPQGFLYTAANDTVTPSYSAPHVWQSVAFSEDGSKALLDDETLYRTSDFTLLGKVPSTSGIGRTALLSPDGRRIYRLITAGPNSLTIDHVDIYDAGTSASPLVKLGEIAVPAQAAACSDGEFACNGAGSFTISPLGDTLFWVGNQRLVVMPIPANLSGLLSAGKRLLPAASR